jgi:flagellar biosynthetic protein FlhB
MADDSTSQEKTEQPTEKRRQDSRKKGQVPRSRELNTVISVLLFGVGMLMFGGGILQELLSQMQQGLGFDVATLRDDRQLITTTLGTALGSALVALIPLLGIMLVSAFLGPLVMGGIVFSLEALTPKLEKLDPIKGLKRIFSSQGLMELFKALGKFLLIATTAFFFLKSVLPELLGLSTEPLRQGLLHSSSMIILCMMMLGAALALIAAVDVPFQLFQHTKKLRMTRQEIKDEMKETEGRPEVKGRLRMLRQEMSQRRMMEDVKGADVIIRNPTHFAVALKYAEKDMFAPRVVGKGKDLVALQIIEVAEEHGITVVSAPPLARALFATTEIDFEIPGPLYVAVAQVLAYVYQLEKAITEGSDRPELPEDLNIPQEILNEIKL